MTVDLQTSETAETYRMRSATVHSYSNFVM